MFFYAGRIVRFDWTTIVTSRVSSVGIVMIDTATGIARYSGLVYGSPRMVLSASHASIIYGPDIE